MADSFVTLQVADARNTRKSRAASAGKRSKLRLKAGQPQCRYRAAFGWNPISILLRVISICLVISEGASWECSNLLAVRNDIARQLTDPFALLRMTAAYFPDLAMALFLNRVANIFHKSNSQNNIPSKDDYLTSFNISDSNIGTWFAYQKVNP